MSDAKPNPVMVAAAAVFQLTGMAGKPWYLAAEDAVIWFRADHPDAMIETEMPTLDTVEEGTVTRERATCRTTIRLASGGGAVGLGTVRRGDQKVAGCHPDFIEKAQSKSVRRALELCGYSLAALKAGGYWTEPERRQGGGNPQNGSTHANAGNAAPRAPERVSVPVPTVTAAVMLDRVPEPDYVEWRDYVRDVIAAKDPPRAMYEAAGPDAWRWLVIVQAMKSPEALDRLGEALKIRNITDPTVLYEAARLRAMVPARS